MANLKNTTIDGTVFRLPAGDTAARPASPAATQLRFNTETGKLEQFRPGAGDWIAPNNTGVIATGGDSVYDVDVEGTTYRVHVFTSTGTSTFSVLQGGEAEYLIVAAGGGGGGSAGGSAGGGGGGAGGLLSGKMDISTGNYDIQIGSGGNGGSSPSDDPGDNGSDSAAFGLTAVGGGGGGTRDTNTITGKDGGSGGGAGSHNNSRGGLGTSGQGNNGGSDLQPVESGDNPGAGGGGAGGPGSDTPTSLGPAGPGGIGIVSQILGIPVYFAGGGGGGRRNSPGNIPGGLGGGGFGSGSSGVQPAEGTPNTGGGGGGCPESSQDGANGGSGIVVIRYPLRQNNPETAAGQDVGDGLVLDLDFAKPTVYAGSGSVVTDGRLNGIEGDLVNGPTFVNPRTHRSAFEFDGVDDVIDFPNFSVSDFISVAMWFKSTDTESPVSLLDINTTGNDGGFVLVFRSGEGDGRLSITWRDDLFTSGSYPFSTGTSDVRDGVWHHAVGIYNGSEVQLYIDGNREINLSRSSQLTQVTGQYLRLGGLGNQSSGYRLAAEIGYCRVYDRGLSEQEVQNLYSFTRWRFGV